MHVRLRAKRPSLRRPGAFGMSMLGHFIVVLYLIAISNYSPDAQRPLYDREIAPHEHQLIWYNLQTKLPAIRRADSEPPKRPPRAAHKSPQRIVSAHRDDPTPAPKIWVPDPPKIDPPKPAPLPNLLAVAPPAPAPPPPPVPPAPIKKFTPAAVPNPVPPTPPQTLADAPKLAEAPAAIAALNVALAAPVRTTKRFTPAPVARAQAKTPTPLEAPPQPDVSLPPTPGASATLAIVGLDPAKSMKIPEPPAPHDAGFSAGPKPDPRGSDSPPAPRAAIPIPDLAAEASGKNTRSAPSVELSPAARQNLLAAMRMGAGLNPLNPLGGGVPHPMAPRVSSSPDPRMAGRDVYTMAIQMPNITSYSGSWLVWFAERNPVATGEHVSLRPPEPMRKVDPKYNADAIRDGIQGIVRLTAVIRKDGSVDTVELLKHLDSRLDATAEEALAKWRFSPATRAGEPVDIDAVFEVPFRLAPKETR